MRRVVLGLDQGGATGWGIAPERGRVLEHGLARTDVDRIDVVKLALRYAGGDPAALWVQFEKHDHMPVDRLTRHDHATLRKGPRQAAPERSNQTLIGMGKNYGVWIGMLVWNGVHRSHLLEVQPSTWRARVHGVTRGDVKQAAIDWASRYLGVPIESHDQAEGVCLTTYGSLDGLATFDGHKAEERIERRVKKARASQGMLALDVPVTMPRPKLLGRGP